MKAIRLTLLALACTAPLLAAAQSWVWVDAGGRKVYSDTAPPPGAAARILRQPGQRPEAPEAQAQSTTPVAAASATATAAAPKAAASAPKLTGKDAALEEKKKQAAAAEAEKKKAEEARVAQVREDNCKRAKVGKSDLSSGMRVARTNAKGEPVVMDDAARAAEMKVLDGVIARDCKALQ